MLLYKATYKWGIGSRHRERLGILGEQVLSDVFLFFFKDRKGFCSLVSCSTAEGPHRRRVWLEISCLAAMAGLFVAHLQIMVNKRADTPERGISGSLAWVTLAHCKQQQGASILCIICIFAQNDFHNRRNLTSSSRGNSCCNSSKSRVLTNYLRPKFSASDRIITMWLCWKSKKWSY